MRNDTKHDWLRRRLGTTALAAILAAGLGLSAEAAPEGFSPEEWVMVVSVINTTNPYMISNIEGAQALADHLGIKLEIVNSNNSSQEGISNIMAILASGKKPIMFVNTVSSSDAPTIVDAVGRAGGHVTIWWNKPEDKRESLFALSCVTPDNIGQYLKYDEPGAPAAFVENLIASGPWAAEPMPLVGGGVEVLPGS